MNLLAAHGLEPGQHLLPPIRVVHEFPALLLQPLHTLRVQGSLGHVKSKYRVDHPAIIIESGHGKAPHRTTLSRYQRHATSWLRKAAPRSREALWRTIGDKIDMFSPTECTNYLRNCGYGHPK